MHYEIIIIITTIIIIIYNFSIKLSRLCAYSANVQLSKIYSSKYDNRLLTLNFIFPTLPYVGQLIVLIKAYLKM
jgi:hypothetical protein